MDVCYLHLFAYLFMYLFRDWASLCSLVNLKPKAVLQPCVYRGELLLLVLLILNGKLASV